MRTINFQINEQEIKALDNVNNIYKGINNYLKFKFKFNGKSWNGCVKAIVFIKDDNKEIPYILKNDCVCVPNMGEDNDIILFYLVGKKNDYRIQTKKEYIYLK